MVAMVLVLLSVRVCVSVLHAWVCARVRVWMEQPPLVWSRRADRGQDAATELAVAPQLVYVDDGSVELREFLLGGHECRCVLELVRGDVWQRRHVTAPRSRIR